MRSLAVYLTVISMLAITVGCKKTTTTEPEPGPVHTTEIQPVETPAEQTTDVQPVETETQTAQPQPPETPTAPNPLEEIANVVTEPGSHPFVGIWTIDYERSLEEAKKSPKYRPEDDANVSKFIALLMSSMVLQITETEIVSVSAEKRAAATYTKASASETSMMADVQAAQGKVTMAFTLIDGEYMNFKSSVSDDMDYFIWQPAQNAVK